MDLPNWLLDLNPDRITRIYESSILDWDSKKISIEVYDTGEVVAIAPDVDDLNTEVVKMITDIDKMGFCEVSIKDQEWITSFSIHGWNQDTFPKLEND